jgi:5-methyltetrahydropteroyltriglutamate--homocysteine methyltransferase
MVEYHFQTHAGRQGWTGFFVLPHILHDYLESRVMPGIVEPVMRGDLQYAAMFKVAQRMTRQPVKFGTIGSELVAFAVQDKHYKSLKDRILAITDALNAELHDLADAGCQVFQFEEPQIHLLAVRNIVDDVINPAFSVEVFNRTVKGLPAKPRCSATRVGATLRNSACSRTCKATRTPSRC